MKIPNAGNTTLPNPQWNWGVEVERATFKMYRPIIGGVALFVMGVFASMIVFAVTTSFLPFISPVVLGLGMAIIMSFSIAGMIIMITSKPVTKLLYNEARELARTKQLEWEQNYLAPYLAERYNLELIEIDYEKNEALVRQDNEEFCVRLNGVEFMENFGFDLPWHDYSDTLHNARVMPEKLSVERIVIETLAEV